MREKTPSTIVPAILLVLGLSCLACKGDKEKQGDPEAPSATSSAAANTDTAKEVVKVTPEQEVQALLDEGRSKEAIERFYAIPGAGKDPDLAELRAKLDLAWVDWMKSTRLGELAKAKEWAVIAEVFITLDEWAAMREKLKEKGVELHVPKEVEAYEEWPIVKSILEQKPRKKLMKAKLDFDPNEGQQAMIDALCPDTQETCVMVTTDELVEAFHANELKAEKSFGEGSYIFLKAEVARVRKAALGQVALELEPPKKRVLSLPVQAYIVGDENQDKAAELSPEDKVLLECDGGVTKSMHLLVKDCRFASKDAMIDAILEAMVDLLPFTPPPSHVFALYQKRGLGK